MLAQKPAALQLCDELGLGPRIVTSLTPRTAFILHGARLVAVPSPSLLGIPLTLAGVSLNYDFCRRSRAPESRSSRRSRARAIRPATSRSPRSSRADSDARPCRSSRRRCSAASTRGESTRCRCSRSSPDSSRRRRSAAACLRAFRHSHAGVAPMAPSASLSSGMGELVSAIGRRLPPGSVRLASGAGTLTRLTMAGASARPRGTSRPKRRPRGAGLCRGASAHASRSGVIRALRRGPVRLDRECRARILARAGRAPASRLGLRRCPDRERRATDRVHVGLLEVGRPRAAGSVLLRAFLGGATDPVSHRSLGRRAHRRRRHASSRTVLGISGAPLLARVHRWRDAGAQHNVGHARAHRATRARLARHPGLFVAGSGFRAVGIPDCCRRRTAAVAAAACGGASSCRATRREPATRVQMLVWIRSAARH